MHFSLLLSLGKLEEGIDHAGLVANLIQVGLIDEVHDQIFFSTVAQARTDDTTDVLHQHSFIFELFIVLKNQLQDVVKIDFL